MDRRSALKSVSILVGGALSSGAMAALVSGCKTDTSDGWQPQVFSKDQASLFAEIAETIIPKTDTAGAKELMVERWVDSVLNDLYEKDAQKAVLSALDKVDAACKKDNGKDFMSATPEQRTATLTAIDKERANHKGEERHYFGYIKEAVLSAYFNTKVGLTEVLQYNANPGAYNGCVPLAQAGNGKTWGSR